MTEIIQWFGLWAAPFLLCWTASRSVVRWLGVEDGELSTYPVENQFALLGLSLVWPLTVPAVLVLIAQRAVYRWTTPRPPPEPPEREPGKTYRDGGAS